MGRFLEFGSGNVERGKYENKLFTDFHIPQFDFPIHFFSDSCFLSATISKKPADVVLIVVTLATTRG